MVATDCRSSNSQDSENTKILHSSLQRSTQRSAVLAQRLRGSMHVKRQTPLKSEKPLASEPPVRKNNDLRWRRLSLTRFAVFKRNESNETRKCHCTTSEHPEQMHRGRSTGELPSSTVFHRSHSHRKVNSSLRHDFCTPFRFTGSGPQHLEALSSLEGLQVPRLVHGRLTIMVYVQIGISELGSRSLISLLIAACLKFCVSVWS